MTQETNKTLTDGAKTLFKVCAQDGCATEKLQRYKTVQENIDNIVDAINNLGKIEGLKPVVGRLYLVKGDIDVNTGYPKEYKIKMMPADSNVYSFHLHVNPSADEEGNIVFRDVVTEAGMNEEKAVSPNDFEESVANRIYKVMTLPERAALEAAYKEQSVNNDTVRQPDVM